MFGATSWALKRLLKFVLKRNLKQWIQTELDLDQLDVQLGHGLLELKEVVLNTDYINERLENIPWRVEKGFVGTIQAHIPLSSLYQESCSLVLEEVFLTVRPLHAPWTSTSNDGGAEQAAVTEQKADWGDVVSDGVRLVSGALEYLLQRLKVTLRTVVVRVVLSDDLSVPDQIVVLSLEQLAYTSQPPESGLNAQPTRHLAFTGLTAGARTGGQQEVKSAPFLTAGDGRGCSGRLHLALSESMSMVQESVLGVDIGLKCSELVMALERDSLLVLICLARTLAFQFAGSEAEQSPPEAHQQWGTRSLFESLMLPDMEGLVTEVLAEAEEEVAKEEGDGDETDDNYGDASSLLESFYSANGGGSLYQSTTASFVSESAVPSTVLDSQMLNGSSPEQRTLTQLHELTASRKQVADVVLEWRVSVQMPFLDLSIAFPNEKGQAVLCLGSLRTWFKGKGAEMNGTLSLESIELMEGVAEAPANKVHWEVWSRLPSTFSSCPDFSIKVPMRATLSELVDTLRESPLERSGALQNGLRRNLLPILACRRSQGISQPAALMYFHAPKGDNEPIMHLSLASISLWLCTAAMERVQSSLVEMLATAGHEDLYSRNPGPASPSSVPTLPRLSVQIAEMCAIMPVPLGNTDEEFPEQCLVAHLIFSESNQELWYLNSDTEDLHKPIKLELLNSLDQSSCVRIVPERGRSGTWLEARSTICLDSFCLRWMLQDKFSSHGRRSPEVLSLNPNGPASQKLTISCDSSWGKPEIASDSRLEAIWSLTTQPGIVLRSGNSNENCADVMAEEALKHGVHRLSLRGGMLSATLTPRTLGPLCAIMEALVDLVPQPVLVPETTPQNFLDVEVHARLTLHDDDDGEPIIGTRTECMYKGEIRSLRICLLAGLGNIPGASAAFLVLDGVEIWKIDSLGENNKRRSLLVKSRARSSQSGSNATTLSFLHVSRPVNAAAPCRRGKRLIFPAQTSSRLDLNDCAIYTVDGDVRLGWAEHILRLLEKAQRDNDAGSPPVGDESDGGTLSSQFRLAVSRLGIHYEPPGEVVGPTAAAVLRLNEGLWTLGSENDRQCVELGGIRLHIAPVQTRPRDNLKAPLESYSDLSRQGYLLVADEQKLLVEFPYSGRSGRRPVEEESRTPAIVASNHQLKLYVSAKSVQLLQRLGRQVASAASTGSPSNPDPAASASLATNVLSPSTEAELLVAVNEPAFGIQSATDNTAKREQLSSSILVAGGGFYENVAREPWSPTGSPPVVVEADPSWKTGPSSSVVQQQPGEQEEDGVWLGPSKLLEDYIAPAVEPAQDNGRRHLAFDGLFNMNVHFESSGGSEVSLLLHGLGLKMEAHGDDGARRIEVKLQTLSLKDSLGRPVLFRYRVSPGGNNTISSSATSDASAAPSLSPQISIAIDGVAEDLEVEYRVEASIQPLRLHLRRRSVDALRAIAEDFGADGDFDEDFGARLVDWATEAVGFDLADRGSGGDEQQVTTLNFQSPMGNNDDTPVKEPSSTDLVPAWPFIQRFRLAPLLLVLDHHASAVNVRALRSGSLMELLYLVPLGGVRLKYRELRLAGVAGLPALFAAVGAAYLSETTRQAHKIVGGTRPIKPLVKAAGSAGAVLKGPLSSFSRPENRQLAWELSRGARKLGKALFSEAVAAAKSAAAKGVISNHEGTSNFRRDIASAQHTLKSSALERPSADSPSFIEDDDDALSDPESDRVEIISPESLLESLMEARLVFDTGSDFMVL